MSGQIMLLVLLKKTSLSLKILIAQILGHNLDLAIFFPLAVAKIINGDYSDLGNDLPIEEIPEIPNNAVAWTDGFGNIKTTMRMSHIKELGLNPGDKVQVILNGVSMVGIVSIGGFQVDRGVLAINAGSSGYEDPFIEFFLRVHHMSEQTAAVRFGFPEGATEFQIKVLS